MKLSNFLKRFFFRISLLLIIQMGSMVWFILHPVSINAQCNKPNVMPNALWQNKSPVGSREREEREFKYAFRGQGLKTSSALTLAQQINSLLNEIRQKTDLWQVPPLVSSNPANPIQYRLRVNQNGNVVTDVRFLDIYFDTTDGLNYNKDAVYRFRQRFDNEADATEYLSGGQNRAERLESMSKVNRKIIDKGLSATTENRVERLTALPAKEIDKIICDFQRGTYNGTPTSSANALVEYLIRGGHTDKKELSFVPKLIVLTERRRQHLQIPLKAGTEPIDAFIITVDNSEVYEAKAMLDFMRDPQKNKRPKVKGSFIEMEVEAFERSAATPVTDDKLIQAFLADQRTIMNQIQDSFAKQKDSKLIELQPENKSKYNQAYEIIFK
jgi:hypothetical protein